MFFIQIILLSHFIFLILILSPIFRLRIGRIKSNLIGHMTPPLEIFINEKKMGLHPKNEIVLWYLQQGKITNKFLYKSLNKELFILPGIFLYPLHIFFSKFRITEKFVYYKVIEDQKNQNRIILNDKLIDDNDIFINSKSYISFSKKELNMVIIF